MKTLNFAPLKRALKYVLQWNAMLLLFCGSLIPAFHSQLSSLPALAGHYRHHVEEHGPVTVIDFLAMHYGADARQHNQEEDHRDLPFFQLSHTSLVVIDHEPQQLALIQGPAIEHEPAVHAVSAYACAYVGGIFQPPKAA